MKSLTTKQFWLDAAERAIKTFLQTFLAVSGLGMTDVTSISWQSAAVGALTAAGLSLATSVLSVLQKDSISPASVVPPV